MDAGEGSVVEWAVAGLALGGHGEHRESGDLHVIVRHPDGALVAVIDGLGHGAEAALAARTAALLLDAHRDEPVLALVQRCHDGLRQTRGVAMSLASFDTRSG